MPVKAEPVYCKSAIAAETDLKPEIEKIGAAYADSFNKQDAAGIAALVASGLQVNPAGPSADIGSLYERHVRGRVQPRRDSAPTLLVDADLPDSRNLRATDAMSQHRARCEQNCNAAGQQSAAR